MRDDPLTVVMNSGKSADICILSLQGPLTLSNLFDFQKALADTTARVTIFDLADSAYIDSTGLGALLKFYVSAKRRGGLVQLVGVNYRIAEMLALTKADTLMKSYPTIEAAERDIA